MTSDATSKSRLIVAAALAAALAWLFQTPVTAARPMLAFFNVTQVEGASQAMADDATKLLRNSLRSGGKVDVLQILPDSPSIRRAVAEGRVTQDDLAKTMELSARTKIAKAVGAQYCLSSEVSLKGAKLSLATELLEVNSGKIWRESSEATVSASDSAVQLTNALQSIISSMAAQLNNNEFSSLPQTAQPQTSSPATTVASPDVTDKADPSARAQRAEESLKKGNIAGAIYELRRAVQSDPKNTKWRILLAQAYVKRGLLDDALRELNRVLQLQPGNEEAFQKIAEIYESKGTPGETLAFYERQIQKKPEDISLRLSFGDLLWRKAKVDEAIKVYGAAAALDSKNVAALDRLARCYAALSRFDESLKRLDEIALIETEPDPAVIADRYAGLTSIVEAEIKSISAQFDRGAMAFEKQEHSREQYYKQVENLTSRGETLTRFLDKVPVPAERRPSYSHRVLACSLLSQAGASLMAYLETNLETRQSESNLYLSEAKTELLLATSADAKAAAAPPPENKATPAPPTPAPPETSTTEVTGGSAT